MRGFFCVATLVAAGLAGPIRAEGSQSMPQVPALSAEMADRLSALGDVLQIGPMLEVIQAEGQDYGTTLDQDMLGGSGGNGWLATVGAIYDPVNQRKLIDAALVQDLGQDAASLAEIEAFVYSDLGRRVMVLELEARRALLDDASEAAAKADLARIRDQGDRRYDLLQDFVSANDLIESNVMAALNANFAFYQGMTDAGGLNGELSEDQMLSDVWAQESDVRRQTEDWLYPFLYLAYQPLSDAELQQYTDFSETKAGQRLNSVLFSGFDAMFVGISRELGRAVARQMNGQDI